MCGPNIVTERIMKIVNLIAALSLAAFAATSAYAADDKKEDKDKSATTSEDKDKDKDKSKAASSGKEKAGAGATTKPEEKKESK